MQPGGIPAFTLSSTFYLQISARGRESRMPKLDSHPSPPRARTVLQSHWYQVKVDLLQQKLHCRCEKASNSRLGIVYDATEGLVVSNLAATASSSARSLPLLCGPWVFWCPLTFLHRTPW